MKVGVVGCGQMGAGIVEVCARAGCEVVVREASEPLINSGRERVSNSLQKAVEKKKITSDEADVVFNRCTFTTELSELAHSELVIEAIVEEEGAKVALFEELGGVLQDKDALLATNTSSIPINRLAGAVQKPENLIGMHFFNPVPLMPVVELIPSEETSEETKQRAETFVRETLNKEIVVGPDRAGFIVNALLIPYLLSAVRFYEQGLATKEHIDTAMELGCNLPMGPLRLCDFIGNDTVEHIANTIFDELEDLAYEVPALLHEMVEHGQLGRKSGSGFYEYN